ncbi:hypothetical protein LINPERPRIM_LOCUS5830 [Linum perenne]
MGCTASVYAKKKKPTISEVVIHVPSMRIPAQSDLQRALKGSVPQDLLDRLSGLRSQIVLIAEDTDGSAIEELKRTLEDYMSVLTGLTKKEYGLQDLVEFKWKNLGDGTQETGVSNCWFELLLVVHLMAMLTLSEANSLMIPKDLSGSGIRVVSSDCKREAVDLLLKASGYLEFCIHDASTQIPPEIKYGEISSMNFWKLALDHWLWLTIFINRKSLPKDLQDGVLDAISIQALGQGTEIQLGLAVECQKASLPVKRRLACEQLIYFSQAYQSLSGADTSNGYGKKNLCFIKWKFLEAKAAAYYYHGLILDQGNEPTCHVSAVCCFLAAEGLLTESKRACLSFSLSAPVTRSPPAWGAMKHLQKKIPEVASRKAEMYGYLLEEEKSLQALPELPEFQLSLRPDEYTVPEADSGWEIQRQEHNGHEAEDHGK